MYGLDTATFRTVCIVNTCLVCTCLVCACLDMLFSLAGRNRVLDTTSIPGGTSWRYRHRALCAKELVRIAPGRVTTTRTTSIGGQGLAQRSSPKG